LKLLTIILEKSQLFSGRTILIGLLTLAIGISTLLTYSKIESSSQQTADVLVKLSQEIHIIDYHLEDVGIYLLAEGSPNAVNIMPGESHKNS